MNKYNFIRGVAQILVSGVVCWFLFSVPNTKFETVVLAGLVLIYANVVFTRTSLSLLSLHQSFLTSSLFQKFNKEDDELNQTVNMQSEQAPDSIVATYLAAANYLVLHLIAIWKTIALFF